MSMVKNWDPMVLSIAEVIARVESIRPLIEGAARDAAQEQFDPLPVESITHLPAAVAKSIYAPAKTRVGTLAEGYLLLALGHHIRTSSLDPDEFVQMIAWSIVEALPEGIRAEYLHYKKAVNALLQSGYSPLTGSPVERASGELVRAWILDSKHYEEMPDNYAAAIFARITLQTSARFWLRFGGEFLIARRSGLMDSAGGLLVRGLAGTESQLIETSIDAALKA